jgi:type III secretion protein V
MVSQIPSLLISVAAGVMNTRVDEGGEHGESSLGEDIKRQFTSSARALYFAALLLLGFATVPGFPAPLFVLLSGTLGFVGYRLGTKEKGPAKGVGKSLSALQRAGAKSDAPSILPQPPQFACPLGVRLATDVSTRLAADALDRAFGAQRDALQAEVGLPFPGIVIWSDGTLPEQSFEVLIFDVPQGRATLADAAGAKGDPATATPETLIAGHTIDLLRRNAHLFLGIQETQWILDQLNEDYPGLVAEVQKALPLQKMADVLRRLLEEQVPIRNIRSITESLIVWGPKEKDMLMLAEYIRMELGRLIAYHATGGPRELPVVLVDTPVEQHIRHSIKQTPTGNFLALPPEEIAVLIDRIIAVVGDTPRAPLGLVASMDTRRYVKRMIESRLPWLPVYSYQELGAHVDLRPIGRLSM